MSKNLFITGTGTGIGKTYVTGLIVKKLQDNTVNSAYYKAAMSGNDRRADGVLIPGDALHVKTVSGIKQPLEEMCPYLYETAVSPHLAARIEGRPIEMDHLLRTFDGICGKYDYVTALIKVLWNLLRSVMEKKFELITVAFTSLQNKGPT